MAPTDRLEKFATFYWLISHVQCRTRAISVSRVKRAFEPLFLFLRFVGWFVESSRFETKANAAAQAIKFSFSVIFVLARRNQCRILLTFTHILRYSIGWVLDSDFMHTIHTLWFYTVANAFFCAPFSLSLGNHISKSLVVHPIWRQQQQQWADTATERNRRKKQASTLRIIWLLLFCGVAALRKCMSVCRIFTHSFVSSTLARFVL